MVGYSVGFGGVVSTFGLEDFRGAQEWDGNGGEIGNVVRFRQVLPILKNWCKVKRKEWL